MLAMIAVDIHLMPDWTILVQLGVFLMAAFVLNFLVFKPIFNTFDLRSKYTRDAEAMGEKLGLEAERLEQTRLGKLTDALSEAQAKRSQSLIETRVKAEGIIAEAFEDARGMIERTELSISSSERSIFQEMDAQAEKLSEGIVASVVGRTDDDVSRVASGE